MTYQGGNIYSWDDEEDTKRPKRTGMREAGSKPQISSRGWSAKDEEEYRRFLQSRDTNTSQPEPETSQKQEAQQTSSYGWSPDEEKQYQQFLRGEGEFTSQAKISQKREETTGAWNAFTGGAEKLWNSLGITVDVYSGNKKAAIKNAKDIQSIPNTQAEQEFMKSFVGKTADNRTDSLLHKAVDTGEDFVAATAKNPRGFMHMSLEQIPNTAPMMIGGWAGTKLGLAATSWIPVPGARVVGGIVGGIMGMWLGNTAVETGFRGSEIINKTGYNREKIISEGAKKGAWVTAADTLGLAVTGALEKAIMRPAMKASQEAAVHVLEKAGMDQLDDTALRAALKANPEVRAEIKDAVERAAVEAAPSKTKKALTTAISFTNEMFTEGLGEYTGSASYGQASMVEAILEAGSAGPTAVGHVAMGKALAGTKGFLKGKSSPEDALSEDSDKANTGDQNNRDALNDVIAGDELSPEEQRTVARVEQDLNSTDPESMDVADVEALVDDPENEKLKPHLQQLVTDKEIADLEATERTPEQDQQLENLKDEKARLEQEPAIVKERARQAKAVDTSEKNDKRFEEAPLDEENNIEYLDKFTQQETTTEEPVKGEREIALENLNRVADANNLTGEERDTFINERIGEFDTQAEEAAAEEAAAEGMIQTNTEPLVKSEDGEVYGDTEYNGDKKTGYLDLVQVPKSKRQQGKGTELVRQALDKMRAAGNKNVRVSMIFGEGDQLFSKLEKEGDLKYTDHDEETGDFIFKITSERAKQAAEGPLLSEQDKQELKTVETNPSEKQKQSGTYSKAHPNVDGFAMTIENPAGSTREGTDEAGNKWSQKMQSHYGYFKRSEGKDGDQVDAFVNPEGRKGRPFFIIDQYDKAGNFDEHKVMVGFEDEQAARDAYLANYKKGWTGLGAVTRKDKAAFKEWLGDGKRTKKPAAEQVATKQTEKVKGEKEKNELYTSEEWNKAEYKPGGAEEQRINSAFEGQAGKESAEVSPGNSRSERAFSGVAKVLGLDAIFFRSKGNAWVKSIGGFAYPGITDKIYVNSEGPYSIPFLVGHESLHQLKENHPELYEFLKNTIVVPSKEFQKYKTKTENARADETTKLESDEIIMEELIADFVGDQFQNPEFWQKMREKNTSFTQQIIKIVSDIINKLKAAPTQATQHIKNFDESLDALADAMSQFAEQGTGKAADKGKIKFSKQSTRVPTAKSATENALDDLLLVDYSVAVQDKATLKKNAEFFRSLPNMRPTKAKDEAVIKRMVSHMVDNILWLHDQVPANVRDRAKLWYDGANRISKHFAKKYGVSEMQSAAVIATMSPGNEWFQNISVAERVFDIVSTKQNFKWSSAMTKTFQEDKLPGSPKNVKNKKLKDVMANPKEAAMWVRTYDQTYNDRSRNLILPEGGTAGQMTIASGKLATTTWGSYGEIGKAISTLTDGRAENIHYQLSEKSHKVRNFYNNIYDPSSDKFVTIDTHAIGAALLQNFGLSHSVVRHAFGNKATSKITGLQGSYPYYAEAFNQAAAKRGILPREMQSIVWVGKQNLFGNNFRIGSKKGEAVAALWAQYEKKKLTQTEVQQQIIELADGLSNPPWMAAPYNEKFDTSYPKEEATIQKLKKFPGKNIAVDFEVAPHPDDTKLTTAWEKVSLDQQTEISFKLANEFIPKVLKEFSTSGETTFQVGGYDGNGNVGFGLKIENSALSVPIAKMIGYTLSQKSVVVASDKKIPGTDPVDIITISLPEGYSVDKINKMYYDLYELTDEEGNHLVDGHTTVNDLMAILNFTGLSSNALKKKITERLEKFSPDEVFKVSVKNGYSTLINEEEYDYASNRPRTSGELAARSPILRRPDRLRKEASERLAEELKRAGAEPKFSEASEPGSEGTVQLTHWSGQKGLQKLDPSYHGQGLTGKESQRKEEDPDHWVDRTYFGLPGYKKEPGLGAEKYTTSLPAEQLYDLKKDPNNLKAQIAEIKAAATGFPPNSLNIYEQLIKQAGYAGYTADKVAAVFQPLKVVPDFAQGQAQDSDIKFSKAPEYNPKKTVKAYKIFRTLKTRPGEIFPLFIDKTKPTPQKEWVKAEFIPTKGFAQRPGWHAGSLPIAPHLRSKNDRIAEGRVWAEIEMPADKDWQSIADQNKTKDIRDKVPEDGNYRFKVSKMQGGAWRIGGAIKINKLLSDTEVGQVLTENGYTEEEARKEMQNPTTRIGTPLVEEARKYDSIEEFKAYGFDAILKDVRGVETNITVTVPTKKVEIKWKEDYENAVDTAKKDYNPKKAEPVDFIYDLKKDKYILDDGHNRFAAAEKSNQPVKGTIQSVEGSIDDLAALYKKEKGTSLEDTWNEVKQERLKFNKAPIEDTKEFKKWSNNYKVLRGPEIADAPADKGLVFKLNHGTTNGFTIFDPTVKGTKEAFLGQVNYFTSDLGEANMNYAGRGPDLTNRINRRAEQLEDDLNDYPEEEIAGLSEKFGLDFNPETETYPEDLPQEIARDELEGGYAHTKNVYVKADNPAFINGSTTTWIENLDTEQYREDAVEEVMNEENVSKKEAEKGFDNEIQDKIFEMSMNDEPAILRAIQEADRDFETDIDSFKVYEQLEIEDGEITATELDDRLRASEELMYAEDYESGKLIQSHIIGQIFKHLGFDAVVLQNADKKFPGMSIGSETSHVHVFEETPENIKLTNPVTYNDAGKAISESERFSRSPDIRYSKAPAEYPNSLNTVRNHTNLTHLKKQPDYKKAKYKGDTRAAKNVVDKIVKPKVVKDIKEQLNPDEKTYIVPVGHREGENVNMLPLAYADKLNASLPNSEAWLDVVKVSGNANTGATAQARMSNEQLFAGKTPPAGSQIIVVDDTLTSGKTFKHLIDAFEDTPIVASSLAIGRYGKLLKATAEKQKKLLDKGNINAVQFRHETNQDISELTAGQIQQYLLNGRKGKDGIRARFRQERGGQSHGRTPQTPQVKFSKAPPEKSEAFKKMFKDTKVVDKNGDPKVVYHGTKSIFSVFKTDYPDNLFFFTIDPEFAEEWAKGRQKEEPRNFIWTDEMEAHALDIAQQFIEMYDKGDEKAALDWYDKNRPASKYALKNDADAAIMPVYLNIKKPFIPHKDFSVVADLIEESVHDYAQNGAYLPFENKKVVSRLKKLGFDGMYLKEGDYSETPKSIDDYSTIAAFRRNQVKSVFNAQPTETSDDIRFSKAVTQGTRESRVAAMVAARERYEHEDFFVEDMIKKQERKRRSFRQDLAREVGGKYTRKTKVPKELAPHIGDFGSKIAVGDQNIYFGASSEHGTIYMSNIAVDNKGAGLGSKFMNALKKVADSTGQDITIYKVTNPKFFEKFGWLQGDNTKTLREFNYKTPVKDWFVGVPDLMNIWRSGGEQPKFSKAPPVETKEFKRWFSDSKVVDEGGDPLVVHHGSAENFTEFDIDKARGEQAFFFSDLPYVASNYASSRKKTIYQGPGKPMAGEGAAIYPAYLSIKKPLIVDKEGAWKEKGFHKEIARAKKEGHDGVIIKNVKDVNYYTENFPTSDVYIAFNPTQIKSATGNVGTFSSANPDIRFSKAPAEKWYSSLVNAVENVSQKAMPAQQWTEMLISNKFKQQGVKEDELAWTGIREWLADQKGKVNKSSIMDYLETNHVRIEEVEKGGENSDVAAAQREYEHAVTKVKDIVRQLGYSEYYQQVVVEELTDDRDINEVVRDWLDVEDTAPYLVELTNLQDDLVNNNRFIEESEIEGNRSSRDTKYFEYTEPGGENYRELLLTLPKKSRFLTLQEFIDAGHGDAKNYEFAKKHGQLPIKDVDIGKDYKSSHWDEANVFVTARMSDYTDTEGNSVLVLHEMQDDWASDIRKRGTGKNKRSELNDKYMDNLDKLDERDEAVNIQWMRDNPDSLSALQQETVAIWEEMQSMEGTAYESDVPNYPFKNTSYDLMLRRLVRYAAENGYDKLGWFPGSTHTKRWGSEKIAWKRNELEDWTFISMGRNTDGSLRYKVINFAGEEQTTGSLSKKDADNLNKTAKNKIIKKAAETSSVSGWLVNVKEQIGGQAGAVDIEAEAGARELITKDSKQITTKEELKDLIRSIAQRERQSYSKENFEKMLDARTDKTWARMQKENSGVSFPRKETFENIYDEQLPNKANEFFNKKKWGKARVKKIAIEAGDVWVSDEAVMDDLGIPENERDNFWDNLDQSERNRLLEEHRNKKRQPKIHALPITDKMRNKALTEGMPMFSKAQVNIKEADQPVTEEDYEKVVAEQSSIRGAATAEFKSSVRDIQKGFDKYLGVWSTRMGNISLRIKEKARKLTFDTNRIIMADTEKVKPLLEKAKKNMTKQDFKEWDYARKNSDLNKLRELIEKYGLQKEYAAYRKVIDSIRNKGLDVGLDLGFIEEYAPRVLKDSKGFLEAIGKDPNWKILSRGLQEKAKALGTTIDQLDIDHKAEIISNMLQTGNYGLGGVSATKERKLEKIPPELNKFYMHSDAALVAHISSMHKVIEARKFFGKVPEKVAQMRLRLRAAQGRVRAANLNISGKLSPTQQRELVKLNSRLKANKTTDSEKRRIKTLERIKTDTMSDEQIAEIKKGKDRIIGTVKELQAYMDKYANQRDFSANINAYVLELVENGEITGAQEQELTELLDARFHERGTRGPLQAYKNFSYMDTMGSPISALTQIGDLAWSAYEGGLFFGVPRTLRNAIKAGFKKSRITREDVGMDKIAQEFEDPGKFGTAVNKVFTAVGLTKIDAIGKESLMNTALEKAQREAENNPEKLKERLQPMFEGETDQVIDDLRNDRISENVIMMVHSRLLDFQAVGLSEVPEMYQRAGNGRIFYMLKTFTIKQFDIFRNEAYHKMASSDKKTKIEGMKNLTILAMFFVMANAGADELKDWVLGRKTDLSDRLMDNILRLCGVSKWVTWKARTEGVGSALVRQILPPFKFIDSAGKDIYNAGDGKGLEIVSSLPLVGKVYYWQAGRGTEKRTDLWDRRLLKEKRKGREAAEGLEEAANRQKYRKEHREDLILHRRINNLQPELNKLQHRINVLKEKKSSKQRKTLIATLEKRRINMIRRFLKRREG